MRIFVLIFVLWIVGVVGCTNSPAPETQNEMEKVSVDELEQKTAVLLQKVLTPEDLNWELNQGEKWKINPESYRKFMQIKQQLYIASGKMENYTEDSYRMLGEEILDFLKTIPKPTGDEAEAVTKVVQPTEMQCKYMVEGDLQTAQISFINLSVIFDSFPEYYSPLSE
jgi:hypothetical protein